MYTPKKMHRHRTPIVHTTTQLYTWRSMCATIEVIIRATLSYCRYRSVFEAAEDCDILGFGYEVGQNISLTSGDSADSIPALLVKTERLAKRASLVSSAAQPTPTPRGVQVHASSPRFTKSMTSPACAWDGVGDAAAGAAVVGHASHGFDVQQELVDLNFSLIEVLPTGASQCRQSRRHILPC